MYYRRAHVHVEATDGRGDGMAGGMGWQGWGRNEMGDGMGWGMGLGNGIGGVGWGDWLGGMGWM